MEQNSRIVQKLLQPGALIDKTGASYNPTNLQSKKVFVLYFSAHWCPPCRQFTPILTEQFRIRNTQANSSSMVIFVSGDRSLQQQLEYMQSQGDWPAVPCQSALQMELNSAFGVRGIPAVIVISKNGDILSREGRQEIMQYGSVAFKQWEDSCIDIDTSIVSQLSDNSPQVFKDATEILLKLIANILRDPQNLKFRRIRLSNAKIETMLLNANGAFETLFSIGFEEDTDALFLPFSASMTVLQAFKSAIEKLQPPSTPNPTPQAAQAVQASKPERDIICAGDVCIDLGREKPLMDFKNLGMKIETTIENVQFRGPLSGELAFYAAITNERNQFVQRSQQNVKDKVYSLVPIEELEKKTKLRFKELFQEDPKISLKFLRDLAVYELVQWFKKDFFTWVDKLKCDICNVDMMPTGMGQPTPSELSDNAQRIEVYQCSRCPASKRFPRYNSPLKLLESRQGRCGEWANCFATILTAFGYLTRFVNDNADHVWCEFYSEAEFRWKHVDPCEGIVDKPKVYDHGWGKKLDYVIAVSLWEVQDVTKRYVIDREALKSRRQKISEEGLNKLLLDFTDALQAKCSDPEKKKLAGLRLAELAELMLAKSESLSAEESQGRQSGSLAWRLSRHETKMEETKNYVIVPSDLEKENLVLELQYDIRQDTYSRKSNSNEKIKNWTAMVFEVENMFKKDEHDWKMAYLARKDGRKNGKIAWKIDLESTNLEVKSVELLVNSAIFESGKIIWQLLGGSKAILPTPGITLKSEELSGSKSLILKAMLSGGKGDVGWQHAQLFRTKVDEHQSDFQLKLIVKLGKSEK